ncbi:hypothetical protein NNO_1591 [Hydrogenimonas sp.]|nr:hypothetical protein NNO_1591 [Hydrogenimonas sp.]
MKKFLKPFVTVLLFIGVISAIVLSMAEKPHPKVVLTGNVEKKPVEIFPHAYLCSRCKMEIDRKEYSAQVVDSEGKTWFFDDIGCLALWLESQPFKESAAVWVYTLDTKRWIAAKDAYYSTNEKSPMHYGFGAYEKSRSGSVNFEEVISRMKKGMHMANPQYLKSMGDER